MKVRNLRKIWQLGLLHFLLLLPIHNAFCTFSDVIFDQLSSDQRLPGKNVHFVYQDSKGIMWFAIESVGLCKYNGRDFTVYKSTNTSNSISNNFPLCITEDNEGFIWIGTTEGLNRFNRKTEIFERFYHDKNNPNSIPGNYIVHVFTDSKNNIWISTRNGLSKYIPDNNTFTNLLIGEGEFTDGLPAWISSCYEDDKGNIWISSYSSGLFYISNKTNRLHTQGKTNIITADKHWIPYKINNTKNPNYSILDICAYDDSTLLLGKVDGLLLFNTKSEKFSPLPISLDENIKNETVSNLLKDSRNKIWVGYAKQGLLMIDKEKQSPLYFDANTYLPKGIKSNSIRHIYEDHTGLIWISSKFQGIFKYDYRQESFNNHKYNESLAPYLYNKFILSIIEDSNQNIWIGTKSNGLFRFNPSDGSVTQYSSSNKKYFIANNRIESLVEDINGNIWAGTEKGIKRIQKNSYRFEDYDDYFIRTMTTDKQGNLWVGTNSSGILYYQEEKNKVVRFSSQNNSSFFDNDVLGLRSINITNDSLVWFSTFNEGLFKYNSSKDELVHFKHNPDDSNSICGNMVRGVYSDHGGLLWIGTKLDGLNTYDLETKKFSKIENTPSTVYNILQDFNNNYWILSHDGLLSYNKSTKNFKNYTTNDGLKNNILEQNALCITHDGIVSVGTSNGINFFNPNEIIKTNIKAPLIISSVNVLGQSIEKDIESSKTIKLSYKDKYISINYALTEYAEPLRTKYKYKLEKKGKKSLGWIESTNNIATFASLEPGEYLFSVLGAYSDNTWTKKPLTIKIIVTSPFWRRTIFFFIVVIILFTITGGLYIAKVRFLRKNETRLKNLVKEKTQSLSNLNQELEEHKEHLEEIVELRTKDLEKAMLKAEEGDKLKSTFLANMSHEIRTPLNAIIGLNNILMDKLSDQEEGIKLGNMIESNAHSLQQLINDIIDISKIEANQLKIQKDAFALNMSINNLVETYVKKIEFSKDIQNIEIKTDIPSEETYIISDQLRIEQIIKNLINNSLKFTKEGYIKIGYRTLTKENSEEFVRFFVEDTGVGIEKENLNKIFKRFEKDESQENTLKGGTGLGLSISYNLAILLKGEIWVESDIDKGTTFFVEIPCERQEEVDLEDLMASFEDSDYNWENKHVLIAEDLDVNYLVLEGMLINTNIKITRVTDGGPAVETIANDTENSIDIVLLDIRMKKMDGKEAMKKIKAIKKDLPVIAQTAFAMGHEEEEILKLGFDDYISKPLKEKDLLLKMARFLEKNPLDNSKGS